MSTCDLSKNVPVNVERIKFAELKRSAIHFKMQPGRIPAGAGLHPTVHHGLGRFLESVRFKCPGGSRPYGRCHSNRIQAPHCVGEIQPLGSNIETKCLQGRTRPRDDAAQRSWRATRRWSASIPLSDCRPFAPGKRSSSPPRMPETQSTPARAIAPRSAPR